MADAIIENLKASFGSVSPDALSKATEEFLKLANEKLHIRAGAPRPPWRSAVEKRAAAATRRREAFEFPFLPGEDSCKP